MNLESVVLGSLVVPDEAILHFPSGLFGFPGSREFAFLPAHRDGMFWLQSVEEPELALVLVDPFPLFPDYAAELSPGDLAEVGSAEGSEDVAILAIVTLPRTKDEPPTANLQGPLAVNLASRLGKQIVLEDPAFGVRCAFDLRGEE